MSVSMRENSWFMGSPVEPDSQGGGDFPVPSNPTRISLCQDLLPASAEAVFHFSTGNVLPLLLLKTRSFQDPSGTTIQGGGGAARPLLHPVGRGWAGETNPT